MSRVWTRISGAWWKVKGWKHEHDLCSSGSADAAASERKEAAADAADLLPAARRAVLRHRATRQRAARGMDRRRGPARRLRHDRVLLAGERWLDARARP